MRIKDLPKIERPREKLQKYGPGKLTNSEVNFYNLGRNVDELLRKVEANIHLAKHPAEACPAQWKKEGDKTLKPSEKLVGRVAEALK